MIDLTEYADIINKEIKITYYPNQSKRWTCEFHYGEMKEGSILSGIYGNGHTPEEAIKNYVNSIRGKCIVFDAMDTEKRREYNVPISIE